jgi:hypothetical protein
LHGNAKPPFQFKSTKNKKETMTTTKTTVNSLVAEVIATATPIIASGVRPGIAIRQANETVRTAHSISDDDYPETIVSQRVEKHFGCHKGLQ